MNSTTNRDGTKYHYMALKLLLACFFLVSAIQTYRKFPTKNIEQVPTRRRLESTEEKVKPLLEELSKRIKLFEETPPNEVKYWFEYTGPLQKYFYRYSKSRGKPDYFEGRDDSGVISARFVDKVGGGSDFLEFFPERLLDNCKAMGAPTRPLNSKGSYWYDWFGGNIGDEMDRCRVLFVMNTVGAGKGTTILWETHPPTPYVSGPKPWMSEQETAAMHIERNLKEIDAMCATGVIAARIQVLVCEPIPAIWTDWMDSLLINCGGKPMKNPLKEKDKSDPYSSGIEVEERASPVQVVVVGSQSTADTCHDLKSGFMEQRMQDLIISPPKDESNFDPAVKTTHSDLVSSDDHDVYVALKWSSLVTTRAVSGFLQASADLAAAARSPLKPSADPPLASLLIPSFVRVSYVSEENNKVAKWRMHGDFFHPAAWEVCKESFDMSWIPHSLSGSQGVNGICYDQQESCGQYWIYMKEEQMPTSPEIYANQATTPLVRGGSNFFWMLTERQRKEIVTHKVCKKDCPSDPQAVIPLGDLESFLINYMPNTALGKKHEPKRVPGYTDLEEFEKNRDLVRERKQLKGQEDIEKALFDYTVYPAALFHKDAVIKACRSRDAFYTKKEQSGPIQLKSSYYDVTITKPRDPTLSWCQSMARRGLCSLLSEYFRESNNKTCWEACGMKRDWTKMETAKEEF